MPFRITLRDWEDGYEIASWSVRKGGQSHVLRLHGTETLDEIGGLLQVMVEECGLLMEVALVMYYASRTALVAGAG